MAVQADPQTAAVGAVEAPSSATARIADDAEMATCTHSYAESNGFLKLVSDGVRLTGAYTLGPEAGEWMQRGTLATRAHIPIRVLTDTLQPFPSFSSTYDPASMELRMQIANVPPPSAPMDARMASLA